MLVNKNTPFEPHDKKNSDINFSFFKTVMIYRSVFFNKKNAQYNKSVNSFFHYKFELQY